MVGHNGFRAVCERRFDSSGGYACQPNVLVRNRNEDGKMTGKIKVYEKIGNGQLNMLDRLWETEDLTMNPSGALDRSILDSLTKYDAIVDIPVGDDGETENGRVIRTDNGFQWEIILGSVEPEDVPADEPKMAKQPKVVEPEDNSVAEAEDWVPTEAAQQVVANRDAEITSLREDLKKANERIETLRWLVQRRDEVIRDTVKLLKTVDTSGI
jgi:hypothetical protein